MVELIRTGAADPAVEGALEYHTVDIGTDANGDGSATLNYDRGFDNADVSVIVSGTEAGDWWASASGANQATINVGGATASVTVTAHVLVAGER